MNKLHVRAFGVITVMFLLLPPPLFAKSGGGPFADVDASSPFFIPITYLKNQKIIEGFSDGTFQPDAPVTRAEALTMILKATKHGVADKDALGKTIEPQSPLQISLPAATNITLKNITTGEETTLEGVQNLRIDVSKGSATLRAIKVSPQPFTDVSEKDWFYSAASEAKRLGIVTGIENKYFKPNAQVNLAQALRMLFKSARVITDRIDLSSVVLPASVPPKAWFAHDIAYALTKTIIAQQEGGKIFPPDGVLHRGELALLLYRFLKAKNGVSFGYASWYGDGLSKINPPNGMEYKKKFLTAAHLKLPMGQIVRVTNMDNGKQVDLVINDRGPYVTGRIIDLSKSAFAAIGDPGIGLISVYIEPLQ